MAKSSSSRSISFWRTDWFAGVAIVAAVIGLHVATDFIGTLERRFYDFASTSTTRQPSERIAVIAIDDQSIANIGRWPWPRDVHARLIDQLAAVKAKTIVHTAFFFEPQVDPGLAYIRKMRDVLGAPDAAQSAEPGAMQVQLGQIIAEAEVALDTDAVLAGSIKNAGNVLLPSVFALGDQQGNPDNPLPAFALKSAVDDPNGFSISAARGQQPLEAFGSVAAGIGHLNQFPDVDVAGRPAPLVVNY